MLKILLLAAVAGTATPVLAASKAAEPASVASAPAASRPALTRRETRYCVDETVTGSRIPYRTCQTRDEWLRDGFDPIAK